MRGGLGMHLLRKDGRQARPWLLAALGVAALALLHPLLPEPATFTVAFLLLQLQWLTGALLVLATARLVHRDAGDSAFLRTRPAPAPTQLAAKCALLALALVPLGLIHCLHIALMGLPMSPPDYALLFAETALIFGAVIAGAFVLALLTPNLARFAVTAAALAALFCAGAVFWKIVAPLADQSHRISEDDLLLQVSRMVMVQIMALVTGILAIRLHARRTLMLVALGLGAVACAVVRLWWPINFTAWLDDRQRVAPREEWPDPEQLTFRFQKPRGLGNTLPMYQGMGYNGVNYNRVTHYYRIDGLTKPWTPAPVGGWNSSIRLSDGRTLRSDGEPWVTVPGETAITMLGGEIKWHRDEKDPNGSATLAIYPVAKAGPVGASADLEGTLRVPLVRPVVLAEAPLREGAVAVWQRARVTIDAVVWSETEVQVRLTREIARLTLRGGNASLRFDVFVINPTRGEHLEARGTSQSNPGYGHYHVSKARMTLRFDGEKPFPDDWREGARLYIVGVESGGELVTGYHFPSLKLGDDQPPKREP